MATPTKTKSGRGSVKLTLTVDGEDKMILQEADSSYESIATLEAILFDALAKAAARQANGEAVVPG